MRCDRRLGVVVVALLFGAACGQGLFRRTAKPAPPDDAVALVLEGSAFRRAGVKEKVVDAVAQTTGRRVVIVPGFSTAMNPTRERLAAELGKRDRAVASYDWKEPRCEADALTVSALDANVTGGYRVALDYVSRTKTVGPKKGKGGGKAEKRRTVLEEKLAGSLTMSVFTEDRSPKPIQLARTATQPSVHGAASRIDVATAVREALEKLPPLGEPQWGAFATRLVSSRCPLLAVAVAESHLKKEPRQQITTAALAAMKRQERGAPPARRVSRREGASPKKKGPQPGEAYSCNDLCALHMVELCNNDKVLWTYYRRTWETTPCGTKRKDAFLAECYEQQWMSGTYQESCVTPCETDPEGRGRLLDILESAGCIASHKG
jgi:hypothetical protein